MNIQNKFTCYIGNSLNEPCPKNCKSILNTNLESSNNPIDCLAMEKMNAFLEGKTSFGVGISAFYQAEKKVIEEFISQRKENLELVSYYLSISEPNKVSDIVEGLSYEVIFQLFKDNYENYLNLKDIYVRGSRTKNFFFVKGNQFWQGVGFTKICSLINFIVRTKKEFNLASQFLVLLPTGVISRLKDYTNLNNDEIKNLYLGMGDSIFELPINNPSIYPHMLQTLEEEMEIFIVLNAMEELVKRQEKILSTTDNLINYYENHSFGLSIQHIYSELNGLDKDLVTEILAQLKQREVLSDSQKDMLNMIFVKGSLDFLRSIREDILT